MKRSKQNAAARFFAFGTALGAAFFASAIAHAEGEDEKEEGATDLISPESLTVTADLRLVGVDGEPSWLDNGFGKLRYGAEPGSNNRGFHVKPALPEANIIWQPRITWSLSGTVVIGVQDKGKLQTSLSEAFVSFKPLSDSNVKISVRAGLMWPPVSLEHSGPDWAVTETITPSAINSWMGEEVKVLGAEVTGSKMFGGHKLAATAAIFDFNDTAGTILAFRGWALHDEKASAFRKQPLPPLNDFIQYVQPQYSHPIIDMDAGVLKRPGYYAKLAWEPPAPIRIEALHYDNNGDPEAYNAANEWGWRTKFDNIGAIVDLSGSTQLRAQAMSGRTKMGYPENGVIWVDTKFRSAFALVTQKFGENSVTGRIEAFGTRNHGSTLTNEDDENGWAATLAAKRNFGQNLTALVEVLHVESDRKARIRSNLASGQSQTQVQMSLRLKW